MERMCSLKSILVFFFSFWRNDVCCWDSIRWNNLLNITFALCFIKRLTTSSWSGVPYLVNTFTKFIPIFFFFDSEWRRKLTCSGDVWEHSQGNVLVMDLSLFVFRFRHDTSLQNCLMRTATYSISTPETNYNHEKLLVIFTKHVDGTWHTVSPSIS